MVGVLYVCNRNAGIDAILGVMGLMGYAIMGVVDMTYTQVQQADLHKRH